MDINQECVVNVDEIKEELSDTSENREHDMLGKNSVKTERSTSESPASEQNDLEEEELKLLSAVYVKVEVDETAEEQDPEVVPLTGREEWGAKLSAGSSLLSVKEEDATEAEGDAETSNERSELAAVEEMGEDASGSNRAEDEAAPAHAKGQPLAFVHCSDSSQLKKSLEERGDEPELLTCDTCQRQFTSRKAIVRHLTVHKNKGEKKTKFPCETCGKEFTKSSHLKIHVRIHTGEKPYVCDYCGKRFTEGSTLNVHLRQHTGEQPFACSICNKRFAYKAKLMLHTKYHFNIKPYECTECGKAFVQKSHLTQHTRVHTGEKPFKCSVCSRSFARNVQLGSHMFTHNREQKHMSECEVCGESFKTTYMSTHMRTHTGEKPFKCRYCEAVFGKHSNRLRHEEKHLDRKAVLCKVCGKSLSSKENLKLHMRCHTGDKPYKCSFCDKAFAHSASCKYHEGTHTREYRHTCGECGKGFNAKRSLDNHVLAHAKRKQRAKRS